MTKIRTNKVNQTPEPTEELNNNTTHSNDDNSANIKKEHKKSRIVDAEKKLAQLEEVYFIHYIGRKT
jgi:hypothetical protein